MARSLDEEKRSAPGARVYITLSSSDITEKVLAGISDTTENSQRANIIETSIGKILLMRVRPQQKLSVECVLFLAEKLSN